MPRLLIFGDNRHIGRHRLFIGNEINVIHAGTAKRNGELTPRPRIMGASRWPASGRRWPAPIVDY